jgi:hypothetical protein
MYLSRTVNPVASPRCLHERAGSDCGLPRRYLAFDLLSTWLSLASISASSWIAGNRFSRESTFSSARRRISERMPSNRASRTFSRCPTSSPKMTLDSRVRMSDLLSTQPGVLPPSLEWMLEFSGLHLGANATVSLWFHASADRIDIVSGNRFTLTTPIDCQ